MSETDPFADFETDLGHSFESLATRIQDGFTVLDGFAHADGSTHLKLELLIVNTVLDDVPREVHFENRPDGLVVAKTADEAGKPVSLHSCDLSDKEEPSDAYSGKHVARPLSQQDEMVIIATLLETCNRDIETKTGVVMAYGN